MKGIAENDRVTRMLKRRSAQHTSMLLVIAAVLWPGWGIFDYLLYPEIAYYFLETRIVLGISCLVAFLLLKKDKINQELAQYILMIPALISVSLALCFIPESALLPFFLGSTMIIIAGFFYLIIPPVRSLVYVITALGTLFLFNSTVGVHSMSVLISHGGILYISITVFSGGLSFIHYRNATNDFTQKIIIEESNEKMRMQQVLLQSHNELIRKQKEKLENQNKELEEALKEREILVKEIHHRVKNNLQIVSSLLSLQSQNTRSKASKEVLEQSEQRIRAMSIIHENLYKSEKLNTLELHDYLNSLSEYLKYSINPGINIEVITSLEPIQLKIDKMVPLGLIFNELFTNALKHAFIRKKSGVIHVTGKLIDENYKLTVKDNGKGFTPPDDQEASGTLGLNLVKGLIKQINGKIEFMQDKGSEISVFCPIDNN